MNILTIRYFSKTGCTSHRDPIPFADKLGLSQKGRASNKKKRLSFGRPGLSEEEKSFLREKLGLSERHRASHRDARPLTETQCPLMEICLTQKYGLLQRGQGLSSQGGLVSHIEARQPPHSLRLGVARPSQWSFILGMTKDILNVKKNLHQFDFLLIYFTRRSVYVMAKQT